MNTRKQTALMARLAGKSYNEINREYGIPKATLSGWLKHVTLSEKASARLALRKNIGTETLIRRNRKQTHDAERRARANRSHGRKAVPRMTKKELLFIGATLYWAEGYKRLHVRDGKERMSHPISFLNSDPVAVRAFIEFLLKGMGVERNGIHLTMRLYRHINEGVARRFWMQVTGLAEEQFEKSTYLISGASKGKRPYNRLPYGTLQVAVYETAKFHYLMGLIEGIQRQVEK